MPYYGLALYKPSILWPPPTDLESDTVRETIRSRLRQVTGDQGPLKSLFGSRGRAPSPKDETTVVEGQDQRIVLELDGGGALDVDSQIQLYAPNNLLSHPLISHCGAYLGGLPPLFFIAGDQEVLKDEIIYT